jgi:hypothetical protein
MEAVVEYHGFRNNDNKFIVKEFALVGKTYQVQILFKSPYCFNKLNSKMQRTARWLTRHYHQIRWLQGETVYSKELIVSMLKPFNVIYTKGLEKAEFLRLFHNNVIEIDEKLNVDNNIVVDCILSQHQGNSKCALKSAVSYARRLLRAEKCTDTYVQGRVNP